MKNFSSLFKVEKKHMKYSHISYKPLQDCDYRPKIIIIIISLTKQSFYVRMKVPIVYMFYMGYFKNSTMHY